MGRGTFGHIAASLTNQPLPFAADMQRREITGAERRFLDWKAAMLAMREPVRRYHMLPFYHTLHLAIEAVNHGLVPFVLLRIFQLHRTALYPNQLGIFDH